MLKRILKLNVLLFVIFSMGCSTRKNTTMTRAYHNLTSHYNVYFNGYESFKKGIANIDKNYKDNYSDILPVFNYSDPTAVQPAASDMDAAVKKAVKCIKIHSITAKPTRKKNKNYSAKDREKMKEFLAKSEYCNWIDDAYLLMGKANFYIQDFYAAQKSFDIVIKQFNKEPIKNEAILWTARTFIEMKKYTDAKRYLDMILAEKEFPKRLEGDFNMVYADYYMRQKMYDDAIPKLETALGKVHHKKVKARITFILAQLYYRKGNTTRAAMLYKKVIDLNPPYEMAFNAKIKRAISFNSGATGSAEIKKQLRKLLTDEKNLEYQDQIYYALAELEMKEGRTAEAVKYYKMAAQKSVSNQNQKAMAFLALADLNFKLPDYPISQAYYDSTVQYLNKTYSEYDKITLKAKNLTELVEGIQTIQVEDSLQRIAKMPEKEREKFVEKLIAKIIKDEEQAKREKEMQDRAGNVSYNSYEDEALTRQGGNLTKAGKWYFYNPSTITLGQGEFIKKWGKRTLEDNWRRKNKAMNTTGEIAVVEDPTLTDSTGKPLTNKDKDFYLRKLPLTDSLIRISNLKIQNAYLKVATVYKEKLNDNTEAVKTLEEYYGRYPNNELTLQALYKLYQISNEQGNTQKADFYKKIIVEKFPNSQFGKMLSNPNYLKEVMASRSQVEQIYIQAYNSYQKNNIPEVVVLCDNALRNYPNNMLMDKFSFLKALCVGSTRDTIAFKNALQSVITQFPESDVLETAKEMLGSFDKKLEEEKQKKLEQAELEKEIYTFDPAVQHHYIVVILNPKKDIEKLKFDVITFNTDNYLDLNLTTSIPPLEGLKNPMITVKSFNNKEEAMGYFKALEKQKSSLYKDLKDEEYKHFIISADNFSIFLQNKDVDRYLKFFNTNYTK